MPTGERVVSDTSPLLNLALIDRLDLIERQFSSVVVPEQVWDELTDGESGVDDFVAYRDRGVIQVHTVSDTRLVREFYSELDRGEAAALALAIETDASLVLIDEREARAAAERHDIPKTGVIGILLRGSKNGTVSLPDELDAVRDAGFWISDELYEMALERDSGSGID